MSLARTMASPRVKRVLIASGFRAAGGIMGFVIARKKKVDPAPYIILGAMAGEVINSIVQLKLDENGND